jgi:nucleoside-diphosphate-sugar epimerase
VRFVVTGHRGFIGRWLVRELADAGHEVRGADRSTGQLERPELFDGLLADTAPHAVVHLAARVGGGRAAEAPARTIRDNAELTALIARSCAAAGTRLVYGSSCEVYGDLGGERCLESGPTGMPLNLYGLSKRWGEEAAQLLAPNGLTIARISMPYGPGAAPGARAPAVTNILDRALRRERITVHRGARRSWCWIGDCVIGMRVLLEGNHTGVFNVGRDDDLEPLRATAERACDLAGAPRTLIEETVPPPGRTLVKVVPSDRLRALGWRPETGIHRGMTRTLDWISAQHRQQQGTAPPVREEAPPR